MGKKMFQEKKETKIVHGVFAAVILLVIFAAFRKEVATLLSNALFATVLIGSAIGYLATAVWSINKAEDTAHDKQSFKISIAFGVFLLIWVCGWSAVHRSKASENISGEIKTEAVK
jgi:hypothetical protein